MTSFVFDPRPFVTAVSDKATISAIDAVLACARDRAPSFQRGSDDRGVLHYIMLTWRRTDSPKQEASFRISTLDEAPLQGARAEDMRVVARTILESALTCDVSQEDLDRWHEDLSLLSMHAAAEDERVTGTRSAVDHCHAYAGSPWRSRGAFRANPIAGQRPIMTADDTTIRRLLPDMPDVVLLRHASFSNSGGARVQVEGLNGTGTFQHLGVIDLLRLASRFSEPDDGIR